MITSIINESDLGGDSEIASREICTEGKLISNSHVKIWHTHVER
jgi:hypothetical protein